MDAAAEKRKAIQAILRDATLTDLERRLRIQQLMDGSSKAAANNDNDMMWMNNSAGGTGGISSLIGSNNNGSAAGLPSSLLSGGMNSIRNTQSTASAAAGEVVACVHYERKCNVVAPCCGRVFGCRVCHDEMSVACGPMDRFAIKEIVCKECNTRQSSK